MKEKELTCQNCGQTVDAVYIVPKDKNSLKKDLRVCQVCYKVFCPEVKGV